MKALQINYKSDFKVTKNVLLTFITVTKIQIPKVYLVSLLYSRSSGTKFK